MGNIPKSTIAWGRAFGMFPMFVKKMRMFPRYDVFPDTPYIQEI